MWKSGGEVGCSEHESTRVTVTITVTLIYHLYANTNHRECTYYPMKVSDDMVSDLPYPLLKNAKMTYPFPTHMLRCSFQCPKVSLNPSWHVWDNVKVSNQSRVPYSPSPTVYLLLVGLYTIHLPIHCPSNVPDT